MSTLVMHRLPQTYLNIKENRVINSWMAEGEQWKLEGEDEPSVKFWGTSVEIHLNWIDALTFDDGDVFTWKKVAFLRRLLSKHCGGLPCGYQIADL